jgi:mono/diheme cytochrome c family protein
MSHSTRRRFALVPVALVALSGVGAACGGSTTPEGVSYEGPVASSDTAHGQAEFAEHCAGCHTEQAGSYGPVLTNIAWTPAHMRQQIREGAGRMPGFDADQISAADLEDTLAYLVTTGAVAAAPAVTTP